MSISRENFLRGNFAHRTNRENHPVLKFLSKNKNKAFTCKEIVKSTGMTKWAVRQMLSRLMHDGKVGHKTPYFIIITKR